MHEALQALCDVVGCKEDRGDIYQYFGRLWLLVEAVLVAPFHAEQGLLVVDYRLIVELVLLQ